MKLTSGTYPSYGQKIDLGKGGTSDPRPGAGRAQVVQSTLVLGTDVEEQDALLASMSEESGLSVDELRSALDGGEDD